MDTYYLIFLDSFRSLFVFSLSQESLWFAALEFGRYSVLGVTLAGFMGATAGAVLTALVGYAIGKTRKYANIDEELYERLAGNFSRYGVYIFLFQMLPFSKIFLLFAGVFLVPWRRLLLVFILGRVFYYAYYLLFPAIL